MRKYLTLLPLILLVMALPTVTAQPDDRSFRMGFTPWPFAFTDDAQAYTYDTITQHADMIVHHMDTGIPWPEALAGEPYHPNVMANINLRLENRLPDQIVYLALTPTSQTRDALARYWGEEEHMPLPVEWQDKTFDDSDVITAYLNHARFMIDHFQPDYFAYTIEITCGIDDPEDPALLAFERFAQVVYPTLKAEYPDLPVFLSICSTNTESNDRAGLEAAARRVLPYSDYVALSTYPYLFAEELVLRGAANPGQLPQNWFSRWADLAPDKPFAIAETGYIAEDLLIPSVGVAIKGRAEWQADYVGWLLSESQRLNAEFVVWFVLRDYDDIVVLLDQLEIDSTAFLIWRDTGLIDEAGTGRLALDRWDEWLALPHTG